MLETYGVAVETAPGGDTYFVRVRGVIGRRGARELESALSAAERSSASRILLDLERLRSLDATGLHVILKASRRSAGNGDRLRVTRGRGHVAQLFRLTALDRTVPLIDATTRT